MAEPFELDQADFRENVRTRNWSSLAIAAFIVWFLEPFYWLLDRVLIPEFRAETFVLRLCLLVLALLLHLVAFKKGGALRRFDYATTLFLALAVSYSMIALVFLDGGYESDYFVGLMFVMIAVGFLFSWPGHVVIGFYFAIFVPFFGPLALGWAHLHDTPEAVSHFVYLGTTAFVTGVSQMYRFGLEAKEFFATRALEHTKTSLEGALDKLKELDRLKSQFFSNITHELRTPLTMIMSPVEAMMNELDQGAAGARYLDTVWKNSLKLMKLINDLLDLAKLGEKYLRLRIEQTDLVELLEEILEHGRPLAARKEIGVDLEIVERPTELYVDLEKMERVIVNLVSNALKFTPSGGHVRVVLGVADTGEALVSVHDTGPGIPSDKLETIFDRFTQADESVTRKYGGTGIGLAFAREIVELHRGTIEVKSVVGEGSVFTIRLEQGTDHLDASLLERRQRQTTAGEHRRAADREPREWSRKLTARKDYRFLGLEEATERRVLSDRDDFGKATKVLIVEDNPEIIRFVTVLLSEEHAVYTATDGAMGLDIASREKPDLVVTDYMMPEMDGVEMIERLRSLEATKDTPIIMLTAKNDIADRQLARERGADVYLSKPFSPKELQTVVRRELTKRGRVVQRVVKAQKRSLTDISAGLAHELHNPLSYIKNACLIIGETLLKVSAVAADESIEPDARRTRVAQAKERFERMQTILETGVSRIEQVAQLIRRYAREGYPEEPSCLEIDNTVRDVMRLVSPRTGRDVSTTVTLDAAGRVVRCIPEEINQALRNLVQNAFDAVDDGGAVSVSTRSEGEHLVLEVKDNGHGIEPEELTRIFAPFFSTKAEGEGMGLGLAIAQQAVEAAGGSIQVESTLGVGSTFRVQLPAMSASDR